MAYRDLREWLDQVNQLGELRTKVENQNLFLKQHGNYRRRVL